MYIASALHHQVLDIAGANPAPGTPIILWPRDRRSTASNVTNRNQHWNVALHRQTHISSLLNGFVLDIWQANPAPGTPLVAWPRHNPAQRQQVWKIERLPDNRCYIVSLLNGLVLDVAGGNTAPGTRVIVWPKTTPPANNQLWRLEVPFD